MKLWIKTQDKKRIVAVDNISVKGRNLRFVSQQYPFGLLLGKYENTEKAQSILDSIFSKLKASSTSECIFEMPENY